MPNLLTARQLAEHLGVSVETIRAWARRGVLPSYRAGLRPILFDAAEVQAALRVRAGEPHQEAAR